MVHRLKKHDSHKARLIAAFAAVYIIWGSTYLAIRFGVETIPPFLMAGLRFATAGSIMYFWARKSGAKVPTKIEWRSTAIIGVSLLCIGNGGLTWSEQRVPSGIAALLVAIVPLWMVLLDWLGHNGKRPGKLVITGLGLGFIGVIILIGPDQLLDHKSIDLAGVGAILVASFSWAYGSLYSRKAQIPSSQVMATAMEMITGGVALFLVSLFSGEMRSFDPGAVTLRSWLSLGYLFLFGSIIGFSAYSWLLRNTTASRVSTYAYVNPVIAIFLGWLIAGEQLNSHVFIAAGVIVLAVIMIITSQSKKKQAAPAKDGSSGPAEVALIE